MPKAISQKETGLKRRWTTRALYAIKKGEKPNKHSVCHVYNKGIKRNFDLLTPVYLNSVVWCNAEDEVVIQDVQ